MSMRRHQVTLTSILSHFDDVCLLGIKLNIFHRKDCNDIWLKFKAGISNQSLCNVSSSAFEDFVDATEHDVPRDQVKT